MTQEEKLILLKDICMRLPYGVICRFEDTFRITDGNPYPYYEYELSERHIEFFRNHKDFYIKPYLRPMSSMTDVENIEYLKTVKLIRDAEETLHWCDTLKSIDWLLEHHFDFRDLIEKGLAIEVTESNNPYK